jgi:hypothetical protein
LLRSTLSPATCDLLVLRVVVARVDGKRFVCLSRSTPRLVGEYTTYSPKCLDDEIPVAVLGLVGYAGLLFSVALRGEACVYLGFLIALVGTLFSFYLTYLEVFVIHALCQWCLGSAVVMMAALVCAAVGVWQLTKEA